MTPCNDGDKMTQKDMCIDGVCVGDKYNHGPKYLTVGEGQCVDSLGKRMSAQQGDVGEEFTCRDICTLDNQCKGYSYAYPVCTIFGTVRAKTDRAGWTFLAGDNPPALEIERVLKPGVGEPRFVCRKKHGEGDPPLSSFHYIEYVLGWPGFVLLFFLVVGFYFRETIIEWVRNTAYGLVPGFLKKKKKGELCLGGLSGLDSHIICTL